MVRKSPLKFFALHTNERGAAMIEYALMAALLAVALIGGVGNLRGNIAQSLENSGTKLVEAPNAMCGGNNNCP
jgi:Flp pilus assembly pilin Flp